MRREIVFAPSARRDLKKLPKNVQVLLGRRIDLLVDNPHPPDTEKIAQVEHCYRIREGDYRVVYQLRDKELLILVLAVGNRKEIYRRLIPSLRKLINQWETGQR